MFLFGVAEYLEDRCLSRARAAIGAVLHLQPPTALVLAPDGSSLTAAGGEDSARPAAQMPDAMDAVATALEQVGGTSLCVANCSHPRSQHTAP